MKAVVTITNKYTALEYEKRLLKKYLEMASDSEKHEFEQEIKAIEIVQSCIEEGLKKFYRKETLIA